MQRWRCQGDNEAANCLESLCSSLLIERATASADSRGYRFMKFRMDSGVHGKWIWIIAVCMPRSALGDLTSETAKKETDNEGAAPENEIRERHEWPRNAGDKK